MEVCILWLVVSCIIVMMYVQQQLKFCRSHLDERSALNNTLEEDRSAKARYLEAEVI